MLINSKSSYDLKKMIVKVITKASGMWCRIELLINYDPTFFKSNVTPLTKDLQIWEAFFKSLYMKRLKLEFKVHIKPKFHLQLDGIKCVRSEVLDYRMTVLFSSYSFLSRLIFDIKKLKTFKTLECSPLNSRGMNRHSISTLHVLRRIWWTTHFKYAVPSSNATSHKRR